jgi:TonB-dependent SusC/RagA subfamily outer membrane receptor
MKSTVKLSIIVLSVLLFTGNASAQRKESNDAQKVTGKVIDRKTNQAVAGAVVAFGNGGVLTDDRGEFAVNRAETGDRLRISYLGYKPQEITLNDKSKSLTVKLDEDQAVLNEVVVIGYGTTSKEKLTGAVTTIGADILSQSSGSNLLEALQGRVPGLLIAQSCGLPGAQASISIRGVNTFTATLGHACCGGSSNDPTFSEPLIIVDGVPFITKSISALGLGSVKEISPLVTLNTNDVERVDILKDADATAIYGTRGSNGVILITTKGAGAQESVEL